MTVAATLRIRMRTIVLVLLCVLPITVSPAQSSPPNPQAAFTLDGSAFALSVSDIHASERWYVEKLGLSVTKRFPKENGHTVTILSGGGLTVELIQRDGAQPLTTLAPSAKDNIDAHGIVKVGILVDDFDKTLANLRARGVTIAMGPWPKRPDQPANMIVKDNAGNLIQFFGK